MKTYNIARGNKFSMFVPIKGTDGTFIEGRKLANTEVTFERTGFGKKYDVDILPFEQYIIVTPKNSDLPLGSYDLTIKGDYEGNKITIALNNVVAVCEWSNDLEKANELYLADQQVLVSAINDDDVKLVIIHNQQLTIAEQSGVIKQLTDTNASQQATITELGITKEQQATITEQSGVIERLTATNASQQATITAQQTTITNIENMYNAFDAAMAAQILKIIG